MPVSINRVLIAGNLTRDPQVRVLSGDNAVAKFGLALNRRYKKGGEMVEETTFIDCEAWGKTAELIGKYLTKGRGAFVEGRLKLEEWTDKEGGKRSRLIVVADSVNFLDKPEGDRAERPRRNDRQPERDFPSPNDGPGDDEPGW